MRRQMLRILHQRSDFFHPLRVARDDRQRSAFQISFSDTKVENVRLGHIRLLLIK